MAQRTGQNKILGLAIGEKSLVVAEAARAGNAPGRVTQAATFLYPDGVTLETPEPLGKALGEFLKSRSFSARQVVVGVPARWVLSKPKEVPPADPDLVAESLRLQVEGEFSQDLQNLVFDYAGETSSTEPRAVLLVAIQDKHLAQIKAVAEAARLQLAGVTPVGCVLAAASTGAGKAAMVVSVGPGGIELAGQDGASPRVLRHLGVATTSTAILAGEIRRASFAGGFGSSAGDRNGAAINGKAVNGSTNGNGHHGPTLLLWDDLTLTDPSRQALADAIGGKLEQGNLETLGVPAGLSAGPRGPGTPSMAGAAALAVAALAETPLPADFLNSRLAAPKKIGLPRRAVVLTVAAVVAVLLFALAAYDISSKQKELDALTAVQNGQAAKLKTAQAFNKRVEFAQDWHRGQPRFLNCFNALQDAIPEDGKTFLTSLTLQETKVKETMKGTISGKAGGDPQPIVDKLNKSKNFKDVKMEWSKRDAGRNGTEIVFQIQFSYVP